MSKNENDKMQDVFNDILAIGYYVVNLSDDQVKQLRKTLEETLGVKNEIQDNEN